MKNSLLLLAVVLLASTSRAQQSSMPPSRAQRSFVIPFQLTPYNNLSIQAVLNERDTVNLMFHLAANYVAVTEDAAKKIKSLNWGGSVDSVKSWGGSDNTSRVSRNNLFEIAGMKWENTAIWEDKYSGANTDGKFGTDLFEHKNIEIDFDNNLITISTDLPEKIKDYEKLRLTFNHDNMFIEAACEIDGQAVKNKFLVHSGYSGSILLDDQFVADNKLGEKLKVIDEKELKDSFGHVLKTKKAIIPVFIIGREQLSDVPVGFFQGAIGRQKMSIIGGDILKRFNIIIDAQREYIYLKANHLKGMAFSNV